MPAPRPVLIDLHERGLDPRHHHTQLDNGRLAFPVKHEAVVQPHSALVALPVNEQADDSAESTDVDVQPVTSSVSPEIVVVASSKKNKKVKTDKPVE